MYSNTSSYTCQLCDIQTNCPLGVKHMWQWWTVAPLWTMCDVYTVFLQTSTNSMFTWNPAGREQREGPRSVGRLFLKMQSGHCIFYLWADWHPLKGASRLIRQLPPRGNFCCWLKRKAEKSYRLHGALWDFMSRWLFYFAWRQQRKVMQGFKGH